MRDWQKIRQEEIDKICEACYLPFTAKKKCVLPQSMDFRQEFPCKSMEGKIKWKREQRALVRVGASNA